MTRAMQTCWFSCLSSLCSKTEDDNHSTKRQLERGDAAIASQPQQRACSRSSVQQDVADPARCTHTHVIYKCGSTVSFAQTCSCHHVHAKSCSSPLALAQARGRVARGGGGWLARSPASSEALGSPARGQSRLINRRTAAAHAPHQRRSSCMQAVLPSRVRTDFDCSLRDWLADSCPAPASRLGRATCSTTLLVSLGQQPWGCCTEQLLTSQGSTHSCLDAKCHLFLSSCAQAHHWSCRERARGRAGRQGPAGLAALAPPQAWWFEQIVSTSFLETC